MDDQTTDHATDQAAEQSFETVQEPGPDAGPQTEATGEAHPILAAVDGLEKLLETELPMATFLMVQESCAAIRKHLNVTTAA